jgi:glutamate synthase domain-containing protein 2
MAAYIIPALVVAAIIAILAIAVHDIRQSKHAILHNFPVVGHFRYLFERIGPELRQYWVADDKDERPFNRHERRWVYASSKGENNTQGFGTTEDIYGIGYPIIKHAVFPFPECKAIFPNGDVSYLPSPKVMGAARGRKRPYRPQSIVNISAMSFGALGARAVAAFNKGALEAGCYHNTGEGGVSPYHEQGAPLMWQIGTGYFGARDLAGQFSLDALCHRCAGSPNIRCIEIKLSQGAKPGKGGLLPAAKVTEEIASIRGVAPGVDCISPNSHTAFDSVDTLIDFIEQIAECTGLPVGIKSAVGELAFWEELAQRMHARGAGPDFISIDGAEGGTGAAPLTFADHVSLPFKIGFARVYSTFQRHHVSQDVVWIGSGKLGFPDRAVVAFAMGCDLIEIAREAMLAIGCIQAQKCHTGGCPAGITTHSPWLQAGLNVDNKSKRFVTFMKSFRKELLALSFAAGYRHPAQFTGQDIEFSSGVNKFSTLDEVLLYQRDPVDPLFIDQLQTSVACVE